MFVIDRSSGQNNIYIVCLVHANTYMYNDDICSSMLETCISNILISLFYASTEGTIIVTATSTYNIRHKTSSLRLVQAITCGTKSKFLLIYVNY